MRYNSTKWPCSSLVKPRQVTDLIRDVTHSRGGSDSPAILPSAFPSIVVLFPKAVLFPEAFKHLGSSQPRTEPSEFSFSFSFSPSFPVLPLYSCLLTSTSLSDRGFLKLPGKYACMHQKTNRAAGPSPGLAEWCRSGSGETDDTLLFFLFVSNCL